MINDRSNSIMNGTKTTISGLSMIWAMDEQGLIGSDNKMPWHLPAELRYFRRVTTGHPILMGRRTFESIGEKPLPKRTNVILSRNTDYAPDGCKVVHSIDEALEELRNTPFFVIGGAQVYQAFLPYAEKLYVTVIHHTFTGDEHFPEVDWSKWQLISEEPGLRDEQNPYDYSFRVYEAIR
jgi:dihydrofolate reductase